MSGDVPKVPYALPAPDCPDCAGTGLDPPPTLYLEPAGPGEAIVRAWSNGGPGLCRACKGTGRRPSLAVGPDVPHTPEAHERAVAALVGYVEWIETLPTRWPPERWPLAGVGVPHEWWPYLRGDAAAPGPVSHGELAPAPAPELEPLRPFRSYAGRAEHAGEAIAAIYAPAFYRPRLGRGEWAQAYRRDQAAAAARSRRNRRLWRAGLEPNPPKV